MKKRNFFCNSVIALSAILGLTLSAQVKLVNGPIPLDGGYSEGVWKDVPEQTPFILLKRMGKTQPDAQTAFKVAADAELFLHAFFDRLAQRRITFGDPVLQGDIRLILEDISRNFRKFFRRERQRRRIARRKADDRRVGQRLENFTDRRRLQIGKFVRNRIFHLI